MYFPLMTQRKAAICEFLFLQVVWSVNYYAASWTQIFYLKSLYSLQRSEIGFLQGKVHLKGAEMLIYLHIVESRFCYTVLYFLYRIATQILCKTVALLKLLMSARGARSCCAGDNSAIPTARLEHLWYTGQCCQESNSVCSSFP